ncbi:hypothetical protein [Siphovirus Jomon_CT89]|nr:hypothetical protein [Siphovirus Jomon_CT89]
MKAYTVERHGDHWIAWHKKEILGVADTMLAAYRLVMEAAGGDE